MAKYKVPSQAASGADTFSDNLVGLQITNGTPQLTNTNFALDSGVIQRDTKNFKTNPFSDFLTLDDLKEETTGTTKSGVYRSDKKKLKFKDSKNDAAKSLFGSLKDRIAVSLNKIIINYPASMLVDKDSYITVSGFTAFDITYNSKTNITQFKIESGMLYNPFGILLVQPQSSTAPTVENPMRNFYSSYKKYVMDINGVTYVITSYTEPNSSNVIILKVTGKPFTGTTYSQNILIRPNDGVTEEFFISLDELEESLLNRETSPKYTASFKVPRDSFDQTKTELITLDYTWPVSDKDNWNILITGLEYEDYLQGLSGIANEIDDYKSNLFIRFLSSPQLFEFDTDGKKAEAVFQLYGQSFDRVKKYIDNIAFMRNVSYDGINNLPDLLLKNLSNTLGLDSVSLIDHTGFDELLYTKTSIQYPGKPSGISVVEAEYEFYRRLLVNLAHIYKSKGTRKSIEFFLKFLGAPEPMIKIDQYVYKVTSFPKSFDLEGDIYDAISGSKTYKSAVLNVTGYSYDVITITGSTSLNRDGYPVQRNSIFPQGITGSTSLFFQKGSGWYDNTADHKSPQIVDTEKSTLTGRTKNVITKGSPYTYGEDYFHAYRNLPGLDTGYELESVIDNVQGELVGNDSALILNRKNIGIYLSATQAIDYDIYRKSNELELTFGTLTPQTGVTFAEFINEVINRQINNSHSIKYKKDYISLEKIYEAYSTSTSFTPYNYIDVNEFINKMSPYWVQVLDQIIPATTLWTGGNIIENSKLKRSKYQYKYGCQILQFDQFLYPEPPAGYTDFFQYEIASANAEFRFADDSNWHNLDGILEPVVGEINELGEYKYDGYVRFYPMFDIDGIIYSGSPSQPKTYVLVSGYTNVAGTTATGGSAKLYQKIGDFDYAITTGTTNVLQPDYTKINELWKQAVTGLTEYINTVSGATIDALGKNTDYGTLISQSGITGTTIQKILSTDFFVDENGEEKIRLTSYKYGPHSCTITSYVDFLIDVYGSVDVVSCTLTGGTATFTMAVPPTNTPTPTPEPATQTPLPPTATPSPLPATNTPAPTSAPTSTPAPTSAPTSTPEPTVPPTNAPTNIPTTTPLPTVTPIPTVTLTPTSTPVPTYAISGTTPVDEGSYSIFTVTTTNVSDGTILYWNIYFNGSSDINDFDSPLSGTTTINGNTSTFNVNIKADVTTEAGPLDTFKVELRATDSGVGPTLAISNTIEINDNSQAPPTYMALLLSPVSYTNKNDACASDQLSLITYYVPYDVNGIVSGTSYTSISTGTTLDGSAIFDDQQYYLTKTASNQYLAVKIHLNQISSLAWYSCVLSPTPTPSQTPTPATPTPTNIPYSMTVYTGGTLSSACANTSPTTVYYDGVLGVGTTLYYGPGYTNPIVPTVYCKYDNSTVYVVGTPSNNDGLITAIVGCPSPTPTPIPTYTYDLYVSDTTASIACGGGDTPAGAYHSFTITGNTTDFCTATSFTCNFIAAYDYSQFWISNGAYSRSITRSGGIGSEIATPNGDCVVCSNPTNVPTNVPTAVPTNVPTAAPTNTPYPTSPPTSTPEPTPVPQVALEVTSFGCSSYEGTGYITLSASNGSGDYMYHISLDPPNPYNGLQNRIGLSNGNYYVVVYDNVYQLSSGQQVSINCVPAPATPTPSPAPPTATPCPTAGQKVDERCDGYTLIYIYADGECGTYESPYQTNSPACNYTPPEPTPAPTSIPTSCTLWTFSNTTEYDGYVYYVPCGSNNEESVGVPSLTAPQYCVKSGTTPHSDDGVSVSDTESTCT